MKESIKYVKVDELNDFKDHPYLVEENREMAELTESIEKEGVLVPLLVRKKPLQDGYEIISGHRRRRAAFLAGLTEVLSGRT